MIEMTKASKFALMKARDFFAVRIERKGQLEKENRMVKIYHLKLPPNRFWLNQKVVHGSTKLFMDNLLSNGLHQKVMICLLKVD